MLKYAVLILWRKKAFLLIFTFFCISAFRLPFALFYGGKININCLQRSKHPDQQEGNVQPWHKKQVFQNPPKDPCKSLFSRIVTVTGPQNCVNTAEFLIEKRVQDEEGKRQMSNGARGERPILQGGVPLLQ